MEVNWFRQKPFLVRSAIEIQLMLMEAGVDVDRATPILEGLANSNYCIGTHDGSQYILRFHQNDASKPDRLASFGEQLGGTLPVPKMVLGAGDGEWSLFEWLPGETLQSLIIQNRWDEVVASAQSIGQAMAQICSYQYEDAGELEASLRVSNPWPSVYDAYWEYCKSNMREAVRRNRMREVHEREIFHWWQRYQWNLRELTKQPCLCHADFKPSNLLVQSGALSGILDWEFAHAGTWLIDAGQILRYLGDHRDEFAKEFEVGVNSNGMELPQGWMRFARIVDLMNLVSFLNQPLMPEEQHEQLLTLLNDSLAWIEASV